MVTIVMLMIIITIITIRLATIVVAAEGVEQEHGGSRRPAATDPDSTAPEPENLQEVIGGERRGTRKHKTTGKGRSCVSNMQ